MSEIYNNSTPNDILKKVQEFNKLSSSSIQDVEYTTNAKKLYVEYPSGGKIDVVHNLFEEEVKLKIKLLNEKASIPAYAHIDKKTGENEGDVGMDIKATSVEYDEEYDQYIYHTGLAFESPKHYGMFLLPRSSARKKDVYLPNSVGVIDTVIYRGEVLFCYKDRISTYERSNIVGYRAFIRALVEAKPWSWLNPYRLIKKAYKAYREASYRILEMTKNLEFAPYKVGDKIGQLMVFPYQDVKFEKTDKLSESSRGEKGFGSTGN